MKQEERDSLDYYYRTIDVFPLLNRKEEIELFKTYNRWSNNKANCGQKARAEGKAAKERLINSNLKLVIKIANKYTGAGLPLMDLIGEGNMGLINAVEKFKLEKGVKLSTYAALWIKQKIMRSLNNTGHLIRLPVAANQKFIKIFKYISLYKEEHGEEPPVEDILANFKITEKRLNSFLEVRGTFYSIDNEEEDDAAGNISTPKKFLNDSTVNCPYQETELLNNKELLSKFLKNFSNKERRILRERFGLDGSEPETLDSIGEKLNLTRERIRQIETAALRKLRRLVTQEYRIETDERKELQWRF